MQTSKRSVLRAIMSSLGNNIVNMFRKYDDFVYSSTGWLPWLLPLLLLPVLLLLQVVLLLLLLALLLVFPSSHRQNRETCEVKCLDESAAELFDIRLVDVLSARGFSTHFFGASLCANIDGPADHEIVKLITSPSQLRDATALQGPGFVAIVQLREHC